MEGIYDISVPLGPETVPWPGMNPIAERSVFLDIARGDYTTGSSWALNSHAGTHIDGPTHFLADGPDIASTSLESYFGRCIVVDLTHIRGRDITRADIERLPELTGHVRFLFKTSNSDLLLHLEHFDPSYVAVAQSAAEWLVEQGSVLAGIDYQGIERYGEEAAPTHKTLLASNCMILEGVDLREVPPGEYLLAAFPLRLSGGEASPVRAVLVSPTLARNLIAGLGAEVGSIASS